MCGGPRGSPVAWRSPAYIRATGSGAAGVSSAAAGRTASVSAALVAAPAFAMCGAFVATTAAAWGCELSWLDGAKVLASTAATATIAARRPRRERREVTSAIVQCDERQQVSFT